eukprot:681116-Rhodomonas_salina.2
MLSVAKRCLVSRVTHLVLQAVALGAFDVQQPPQRAPLLRLRPCPTVRAHHDRRKPMILTTAVIMPAASSHVFA